MNNYQAYIDVPQDEDWDIIDVYSIEVEAFNKDDAFMQATREAQEKYENFYVWEITETDIIEK